MSGQQIKLAFVGTGSWARSKHFPALAYLLAHPEALPGVELSLQGIYSLEADTARAVASQVGFRRVYDSLDALLDDDAVNAIAVAVLPEATASVVRRVATRMVPLFCEKPPGISVAEAQGLADLVTVPHVVAFNRRFAPLNNQYRTLVHGMQDITFVEGHFLRYERYDPVFMAHTAIHWVNFMEYVFGEIRDVNVDRFCNPNNAIWNCVTQLTFAGGLRGLLKVLPCSGSEYEKLEVHSTGQSAYLTGPYGAEVGQIYVDRNGVREMIAPVIDPSQPEIVRVGIVGEYVEFFTAACAGKPTRSTFRSTVNGMRVVQIMEGEEIGPEPGSGAGISHGDLQSSPFSL